MLIFATTAGSPAPLPLWSTAPPPLCLSAVGVYFATVAVVNKLPVETGIAESTSAGSCGQLQDIHFQILSFVNNKDRATALVGTQHVSFDPNQDYTSDDSHQGE